MGKVTLNLKWWMELRDGVMWCTVCDGNEHTNHADDCPVGE